MVPLIVGASLGVGAAGQALGFMGQKKAAKQRAAAIARYQAEAKRINTAKADDQWKQGRSGQASLGQYLGMLQSAMGQAPTAAPKSEDFAPAGDAAGQRDDAWKAAYRAAIAPKRAVDDASLQAEQAAIDRGALSRALSNNAYATQLPVKARSTQSRRTQFRLDQEMADAERALNGFVPSNGAYNMQMLGGALSTIGNAGMMYGAFRG